MSPRRLPLVFALVVAAVCGPVRAQSGPRITEWVDLSLVTYPRIFVEPGRLDIVRERLKARKARHDFAAFPPSDHPDTDALVYLATGLDSSARGLLGIDGPLGRLDKAHTRAADRPAVTEVINDLAIVDLLLGWDKFPPEHAARLRRTLAALAYELADDKGARPRLEPGMPESALPLWTAVALEMIAELLPHHPHQAQWRWAAGLRLADAPLPRIAERSDDFVELSVWEIAPRLLHELIGAGRQSGRTVDPALRDAMLSLARRSTPFDAARNTRTLFGSPLLGPRGTAVFGWAAALCKTADPALAAEMNWWHDQFGVFDAEPLYSGSRREPAVITLQLADDSVGSRVPTLKSAAVAGFGGVIRDDAPSPGELYVALPEASAAGLFAEYYHQAFPVMTAAWHPTVAPDLSGNARREFSVTRFAEYMTLLRGNVRQQVIAIKSPVAAAPQYVLLRWDFPKCSGRLRLLLAGSKAETAADGQLLSSYPRLAAAVTARLVAPTVEGSPPKPTALPDSERGMGRHEFAWSPKDIESITLAAYPHEAGNPVPSIKPIAGGAGVRIEARGSTQWVFLSPKTVKFETDVADFEGTVGAVREAPAVRSIQIFNGGKARTRDWTVETDGDISVLQRGPSTLLIESDGQSQQVKITWRRVGRSRPEAIIDGKALDVRHEEESALFDVPAGKHNIRIDFGS